jgi:predicted enzyme related to lactoylglutathione lyase
MPVRKSRPAAKRASRAAKPRRAKAAPPRRAKSASAKSTRATARRAPAKAARRAPAPAAMAAVVPNAIGFLVQHMDYTSHDLEGVKRFYTELLGFTDAQYMPEHQYLAVKTGATSSLGFMPPMPGPPEQWRPPREPTLYIGVADVDRAYRDLTARGVTFEQPPTDMPWGHRVAQLRDPEGRSVTLAETLKR